MTLPTLVRRQPMGRSTLRPAGRQRKCAVCREAFTGNPMQVVCGVLCAIKRGQAITAKQKAKARKAERAADRQKREELKSRSQLIAEAQAAFNLVVRLEDAHLPCISCGTMNPKVRGHTGGVWDAGHYLSRGSAPHLRFDRRNVHKQCKGCNRPGGCTREDMRRGVEARIGREALEALECDQDSREYTKDDLRKIRDDSRRRAAQLKKETA